ncbi:hypothetical protein BBK36DRAFT_1202882 [Trichoderma citrinoviride]|uniref:Zn(2)-C6 fungal-type domain-containing protein n=1 Tax=Trichoderma citrinoviride TaxID=58853 RepID=A0A2T4B936_9HYPO|nr:hypothetical protein BBK36DRAFT_1202882 [Trichoderma citrinoviride]PTB65834.1 hypothetical protein BBK36DRAFT_1202882 [Trichoderma citrinoviride]
MASTRPSPESVEGPTPPRADNVCLACRRKKKKCDKALPGCLQCKRAFNLYSGSLCWLVVALAHKSRLHLQCIYEDTESVPVIEEFRQLRKKLKLFEEMLIPGTSRVSNPPTRPAVDLSPPDTADEPSVTGCDLLSRLEALASKLNVGEEVYQLLQSHPGEIYGASQIYFDNIHKWMPIMSQKLFYRRLTEFSKTRRPDFALLLLSIVLCIHCPASGTTQEPLYRAVRSTFWSLNATIDASLEMVQAGVLLSCYEYGFGMYKECYKTIGLCVRMGQLMGIQDEKPPSDELQFSDEWIRIAERCNLWWALVIRDRSTLLHGPFRNSQDAMPDHLPLEAFDLDPSFSRIGDAVITRDPAPGIFGYQAVAWRLFDKTVAFRRRVAKGETSERLREDQMQLDAELQSMMRCLVDLYSGATCGYCEPSATVLVSLLLLHGRHRSIIADTVSRSEMEGIPPHCFVTSSMAVKTIVRMIVDIAHTINNHYRKINIVSFPPTYCQVIYRATLELISFRNDMDEGEWTRALETLREATWNYGRRWQAAGKFSIPTDAICNWSGWLTWFLAVGSQVFRDCG